MAAPPWLPCSISPWQWPFFPPPAPLPLALLAAGTFPPWWQTRATTTCAGLRQLPVPRGSTPACTLAMAPAIAPCQMAPPRSSPSSPATALPWMGAAMCTFQSRSLAWGSACAWPMPARASPPPLQGLRAPGGCRGMAARAPAPCLTSHAALPSPPRLFCSPLPPPPPCSSLPTAPTTGCACSPWPLAPSPTMQARGRPLAPLAMAAQRWQRA